MNVPGPLIVAGACAVVFIVHWLLWRRRQRLTRFVPTNELERLLVEQVGSTASSPAICQALASGQLLAIESRDVPEVPMTFSATFPPDFAEKIGNHPLSADGQIEFGPYILCFSSPQVVKVLSMDAILSPLVTKLGKTRSYPSRQVFQSARDRNLDVLLNPFFGVSHRFDTREIDAILSTG